MSLEAATHRVFPVPRPGFPAAAASGDEGKKARPFSSGRVETGKLNRPDFDLHAPILTREAWRNLNDEECAAAPKRRGDPFLAAQRYSTVRSTISLPSLHRQGRGEGTRQKLHRLQRTRYCETLVADARLRTAQDRLNRTPPHAGSPRRASPCSMCWWTRSREPSRDNAGTKGIPLPATFPVHGTPPSPTPRP